MKLTRTLKALFLLAIAALVAAGCGSSSGDDGNQADAGNAQAAKYSQCMRDNGVSEFPDPDASGELTIDGVLNGSGIDPDGPGWKQASEACKDLEPAGYTGDMDISPEQQQARLEFAQCIREHGVTDFPDPAEGQPLVDTNRIPSSASPEGMTALNAAMKTCGDIAERAIGQ